MVSVIKPNNKVIELNKLIEHQATIIMSLQKQVEHLQSKVTSIPISVFEDSIVHESNIKIDRPQNRSRLKIDRCLEEMQALIKICENPNSGKPKKDKAKERLAYLDSVKSFTNLYKHRD